MSNNLLMFAATAWIAFWLGFLTHQRRAKKRTAKPDSEASTEQLSAGRVGWLVTELDAWAASRPISEILPPTNTGVKRPRAQSPSR